MSERSNDSKQGFSVTQRWLHWIAAMLVLTLLPVGFWMVDRAEANIWDGLTGTLYASHKAFGFLVLWLVAWRLILRAINTAPEYPASVSRPIRKLAKITQWLIYALLLVIPLLGWAGVTAFGALNIFLGLSLPAMPGISPDKEFAKELFAIHGWLAVALCALLFLHIAGALKHRLIDRDGVFDHMSLGSKNE
ncbi:MAG: cytochrome b [Burkholderiaceae bacterium]|nr:cytochrome b [Burkholderiaceae bacterium]